jgi:hypothetical protein
VSIYIYILIAFTTRRKKLTPIVSTVTQEVLIEHGSWEFPKQNHWNVDGERKIIHTVEAYVPISLDGDLLDIMIPPTEVNGTDEPGDLDLASRIYGFLDGRKDYIESRKNKIYLDEADAVSFVWRLSPCSN